MSGPIGANPLGALGDEVEALAALGSPQAKRRLNRIIRSIKRIIRRAGETVLIESKDGTQSVNVRVGVRTMRDDVALTGGVIIGDYELFIPAKELLAASFNAPIEEGVKIWRFPDTAAERKIRINREPKILGVEDTAILYRCIGQG